MLCLRVLSRRNLSYPSRRSTPNYRPVNLLRPLHPLFATPVLCFQQLAASFPKTPGWGVARFPFQRPTSHCPLLTTRSPLTTFRMNTCKGNNILDSVSRAWYISLIGERHEETQNSSASHPVLR